MDALSEHGEWGQPLGLDPLVGQFWQLFRDRSANHR